MKDLAEPYVQGLTLLGGEPFLNTGILIPLVKRFMRICQIKIFGLDGLHMGKMMLETPDKTRTSSLIDILVDGRFDKANEISCYNFEAPLISVLLMYKSLLKLEKSSFGVD